MGTERIEDQKIYMNDAERLSQMRMFSDQNSHINKIQLTIVPKSKK